VVHGGEVHLDAAPAVPAFALPRKSFKSAFLYDTLPVSEGESEIVLLPFGNVKV